MQPTRDHTRSSFRRIETLFLALGTLLFVPASALAAVVATSGTVQIEPSPHAAPADGVIYVFDEQRSVAFVSTQPLQLGAIAPGTLVDSHYVQFDPVSPTGFVGSGSITFDGPILGLATSTGALTADLSPEVADDSDGYFGLADTIGAYPAGAQASARGLGSPQDDLIVTLGSKVLTIDSLEIPTGSSGNVDGFRVFTAASSASVPTGLGAPWLLLAATALGSFALSRRVAPAGRAPDR